VRKDTVVGLALWARNLMRGEGGMTSGDDESAHRVFMSGREVGVSVLEMRLLLQQPVKREKRGPR